MLTSVTIENFRTFKAATTIPLKPLTVFVGPNNSGKTNAIRAIQTIAHAMRKGEWLNEHGLLPTELGEKAFEVTLHAKLGNTTCQISLGGPTTDRETGSANAVLTGEHLLDNSFDASGNQTYPGGQFRASRAPEYLKQLPALRKVGLTDFLTNVRVASLSVSALRQPADISAEPMLGEHGENFGAYLDWIAGNRPATFAAINAELKSVLGIDGCTTRVASGTKKIPAIVEGGESYGADVVSDGVLLYLGLTTAAHMVGPKSLLIIEEPENGIHPRRLSKLLEQIRHIGATGTQVILTTHSTILLDEFSDEPESIVVFDRGPNGTTVKQLEHDKLKSVLDGDFGAGSLWFSGAIGGVPT